MYGRIAIICATSAVASVILEKTAQVSLPDYTIRLLTSQLGLTREVSRGDPIVFDLVAFLLLGDNWGGKSRGRGSRLEGASASIYAAIEFPGTGH